jgi:peptide/nickel transport system ATP-binding protein
VNPVTKAPPLLEVEELSIAYGASGRDAPALRGLSFRLQAGEALGLVGESGAGKSTAAYAVMGHLSPSARVLAGHVRFAGQDVLTLAPAALQRLRGARMALVDQEPGNALNPALSIGEQLCEGPRLHLALSAQGALARAEGLLAEVGLADAPAMLARYPHQLSGGQQQRVAIAIALISEPALLILDEPTSGLDVTVAAAVLDLILDLRRRRRIALLLISHNLGAVARVCDRVGVMYAGELVEEGPVGDVFAAPRHPYTRGLIASLPSLDRDKHAGRLAAIPEAPAGQSAPLRGCGFATRCMDARPIVCDFAPIAMHRVAEGHHARCARMSELQPWPVVLPPEPPRERPGRGETLLTVRGLSKDYAPRGFGRWWRRGGGVRALDRVDLDIKRGETLALVGESGSGKTTLAKAIAGLEPASAGTMEFDGADIARLTVERRSQALRRRLQMVFQNPDATLNPRHSIGFAIARALRRAGGEKRDASPMLRAVRLPRTFLKRKPGQLSGGQKQRVAIARALAGRPALVIADEPLSALDASVQAAIMALLLELQAEFGTAYLFISHDLAAVRYLADRVAVMYGGRIVEYGTADELFAPPFHPYTKALLDAAPMIDGKARPSGAISASIAAAKAPSALGCVFAQRCPKKIGPICDETAPLEQVSASGHRIACHIPRGEL